MIFAHILHPSLAAKEPLAPLGHRLGSPDAASARGTTGTVPLFLERVIVIEEVYVDGLSATVLCAARRSDDWRDA